jgi:hypothetical protein
VRLVRRHVDYIAVAHRLPAITQPYLALAPQGHDDVLVLVTLVRGIAAGLDLEVAQVEGRALFGPDE